MNEDKLFQVEIISPAGMQFSGMVEYISLPGSKSPFRILHSHAPIVTSLDKGVIELLSAEGETKTFDISGGIADNRGNKVTVLTNE